MKNLLIVLFWLPTTLVTLVFTLSLLAYQNFQAKNPVMAAGALNDISQAPYRLYASIPKVLGAQSVDAFYVKTQDVTPQLVHDYLKKHKSPMLDSSQELVLAARKYELDPLLLVAIAQCESNLGKKMPPDCNNPFGWGIHSRGTLCFSSWEEGYETVAKGLREKYFNKGLSNPEEIMEVYTPPALEKEGSWAKCVNQFMGKLTDTRDKM